MKKVISTLAVGGVLVVGLFFAQDNAPTETAMDLEPTILSVQQSVVYF